MKKILKKILISIFIILAIIFAIGGISSACDKKENTAYAFDYNPVVHNLDTNNYKYGNYFEYDDLIRSGSSYDLFHIYAYFSNFTLILNCQNFTSQCQMFIFYNDTYINYDTFDSIIVYFNNDVDRINIEIRNVVNNNMVGKNVSVSGYIFQGDITQSDYLQGYLTGKADGIKESIVDINNTTADVTNVQPIIGEYVINSPSEGSDTYNFNSTVQITDKTVAVSSASAPSGFSMRLNMALVPQRFYRLVYDNISIPPTSTRAFVAFRLNDNTFYEITPINKSDRTTYFSVDREVSELYIIYGETSWNVTNLQLLSNNIDTVYEEGYSAGYNQGNNDGYTNGYANAVEEGTNATGILYGLIAFTKLFFQLATTMIATPIAGDITVGLIIFGIPLTGWIISLIIGFVYKILGARGASANNE